MEYSFIRRIPPTIVAFFTKKDRYFPILGSDFEWNRKSWVHNIFRVYELVFGREFGIRAESTTCPVGHGGTTVFVHSFEAACAYTETFVRSLFALPKLKLVKVYIPQLAPAGFGSPSGLPYLFAIAFDVATNGGTSATASVTFSHTNTGSNLTLIVCGAQNGTVATASSATYNTVSMTQTTTKANASQGTWMDMLALAAPATGANNVVWTANQSNVGAFAMSLTGTNASPIGATGTPNTWIGQTSSSISVTTTAANSWVVDHAQTNNATPTATGSGQTIRFNGTHVGGNRFYSSTMTTTTTGAYTPGYSWTGNADGTIMATEIKEAVASGPANLKSLNTNLKANIKSINTNLIANVKSFNTNT